MPRELPSVGTVSYNGYTFPEAFSMNIRSSMELDSAGRSSKYISHVLTIDTIILPDDPPYNTSGGAVDTNMDDLKKKLEVPGKALVISDQGFGNININGDTVVDSKFGPTPELLEWSPVGSNRACRVLWQCKFTLPVCSSGVPLYKNSFSEFTYETNWSISDSGMTVRTLRSTMEIPIQRDGNKIKDVADSYREYFNPPVPLGFKRERNVQESRDKRTLDVTIIDTEINSDNPYPAGVTKIDMRHSIESDYDNDAFILWHSNISGTIEVAPNVPKIQAWQIFRTIVNQRYQKGNGPVALKGVKPTTTTMQGFALRKYFRAEESIFTRELSFEIEWDFLANLTDAFMRSGLFMPVEGTNWQQWHTSVADVQHPRGVAKMRSLPTDDVIVSLCSTAYPTPNSGVVKPYSTGMDSPFADTCPPPESSYHIYKPCFEIRYNTNIAQHAKLVMTNLSSIVKSTATSPNPSQVGFNPADMADTATSSPGEQHNVQIRGKSVPELIFYGYAQRYCYQIPVPQVASWGGVTPYQAHQSAKHFVAKVSTTRPLYAMIWYQVYKLDGMPNGDINTIQTSGIPEAYGVDRA